jgi:hypothetical protein
MAVRAALCGNACGSVQQCVAVRAALCGNTHYVYIHSQTKSHQQFWRQIHYGSFDVKNDKIGNFMEISRDFEEFYAVFEAL